MRTKRVGTISMGLVLVGFGLVLLIGQFSKISAIEIFISFFPAILIILGCELLYCGYKRYKDGEDMIIKYDVFSIFIVTGILAMNICIYGLIETGVMNYIRLRVAHETHMYQIYADDIYKH